jgi:hypothetical protein
MWDLTSTGRSGMGYLTSERLVSIFFSSSSSVTMHFFVEHYLRFNCHQCIALCLGRSMG